MERCKNPQIAEITTTYKKRVFNLSDIVLPQGVYKKCVWCLGPLKGARRRWCGDDCLNEASAWGNPQKEYGLGVLLIRQNFKCNICAFDWGEIVEGIYAAGARKPYGWVEAKETWRFKFNFWLAKKLKYVMASTDKDRRLEVDHILAISKGGQSVGLGNHQAICHLCHKEKTKVDNSGPRKKKLDKSDTVGDTGNDSNLTQGRVYDQENTAQFHNDSGNDDLNELKPGKPVGIVHD